MLNTLKGLINVGKHILGEENSTENKIDDNIGAEILSHYQQQWAEMHQINEDNATKANKAAEEINRVHKKISIDHSNLSQILFYLSESGNLKTHVNKCLLQVSDLYDSFDKIEKSLLTLEDLIEKVELEQKKIDHRHQLALYKERKLGSLEDARSSLATKHAKNVVQHELKQKRLLQEKQQVFQEAFKQDLEAYKSLGALPKISRNNSHQSALLEEVHLELDKEALDQFLEDK